MNSSDLIPKIGLIGESVGGNFEIEKKNNDVINDLHSGGGLRNRSLKDLFVSRKKLILFLAVFLFVFFVNLLLFFNLYLKTKSFYLSLKELKASFVAKDLGKVNSSLDKSQDSLSNIKSAYSLIKWTGFIPLFGGYTQDLGHVIDAFEYAFSALNDSISLLEPHLGLLGFTNSYLAEDAEKTTITADKIAFITQALPNLLPEIKPIVEKISLVEEELIQINPGRYPVRLGKVQLRSRIVSLLQNASKTISALEDGEPLLQELPYILGIDSPRRYLVLFQNDKELRPTGGFMTAYALMEVRKATFDPVSSDDIYNLDSKYKPSIPAPDPLVKYLGGPYAISGKFRLRDLNWYPDFYESMNVFVNELEKVGISDIDGVIAVDTQFLVKLLGVLGPIQVTGYGTFSDEIVPQCNCPQVVYELESLADIEGPIVWDPSGSGKIIYAPPNWLNRKKMIGPLMNSIASYSLGQPSTKLPELISVFFQSFDEKHILAYFKDDKVQEAADKFGITGRLLEAEGDYLYINDANLGGRKSNLYVTQEVNQEISIGDNNYLEKRLVITYKNPEKHDGWLNSVLPNWVRIYIPKGSQVLSIEGLRDVGEVYEEAGKMVISGFFELRPQGIVRVEIKYRLPFKFDGKYQLFIQKQPGKNSPLYTISFGKMEKEIYLSKDTELVLSR